MKRSLVALSAIALLAACGKPNTKKAVVVLQGKSSVNEESKAITVGAGSGNSDKTVSYNSAEKVTLSIAGDHQGSVDLAENGYYIVNATPDTIVGSFQTYSAPKNGPDVITQDALKKAIDSLQQLIVGANITPANRNYFVPPFTAVKVSANSEATIVTPYHQMTAVEKEEGKEPEVYRFFSVAEIRERLVKLEAATKPVPPTK